jgi:NAD(P)-dependent dehydrogenase (short-subunit alcohol dehydrogenase family)
MDHPVVLITGALAGIGRATALAYAEHGAAVVVSGRQEDAGRRLEFELCEIGARAYFVAADIRFEDQVCDLVDRAVDRFGRLDIAVNSAGTEGEHRPFLEHTQASLSKTIDTNLFGTFFCMKHEIRAMLHSGRGSIVNVSSIFGHRGKAGTAAYAASKHAIEALTKSAALEFAGVGIRVNSVAPGGVTTDMLARVINTAEKERAALERLPLKRFCSPEEVAETIMFLASNKSSYITGQSLCMDGGKLASTG